MTVLSFDVSSGGVSAAFFDSKLNAISRAKSPWRFDTNTAGAATLSIEMILERVRIALKDLKTAERAEALGIGCFMHNCLLLDAGDRPLTPVFTWLDQRGEDGVTYIRRRLGDSFHERTGCRYHPMFPVFKLAALYLRDAALVAQAKRVVSAKAFLVHRLTDKWIEDHGMASSSGLFNLTTNDWDPLLLSLVGLNAGHVPQVASRTEVAGRVTAKAAAEFGLSEGMVVINGSGDGFMANVGSDCTTPSRICVTLGTSAVARQALPSPVVDASGTFCYKADHNQFLLGCAGNNGGNVLDWGRAIFGDLNSESVDDGPIFIPLLYGERSPEWDPRVTGSFRDLTAQHTGADLGRSVLEGVVFNLQLFTEILQETSGKCASEIVLSGNGFLNNRAAQILASIAGIPVLMPREPGIGSLRGGAICVFQMLKLATPPLETQRVPPLDNPSIAARYQRYKQLRRHI
jgi:gluconokinase